MSYFNKVKIGQAASDYSKFDLSSDTLTTTDIGEISVVHCFDCIIGDKYKIETRQFARTAPLVQPTFAEIVQRSLKVFVPYYQIADDADAFLSGQDFFGGVKARGRWFRQANLDGFIWRGYYTDIISSSTTSSSLRRVTAAAEIKDINDYYTRYLVYPRNVFIHEGQNNTRTFFKLTSSGKTLYKLLRCLGYDVNKHVYFGSTRPEGQVTVNAQDKLNLYPLLCYMKAYADLILPNAFYSTSPLVGFLHKVKSGSSDLVSASGVVDASSLYDALITCFRVYYDSDYFTTSWQKPNSPLSSVMPTGTTSFSDSDNDVTLSSDSTSNKLTLGSTLSATQLNFLRSFDNFVRRNNLVGFRDYNAVYARYGLKPSELRSNYCYPLDISGSQLNVGDVTSTSQTEEVPLGGYAGKAFQNDNQNLSFECKDFGFYLHIAWITVKPVYFQGLRRHVLKVDPLDFYQPEFDGAGPMAISKREINSQFKNEVFGFTERYNDYRFALSTITGDFELDEQQWAWHAGRDFLNDFSTVPAPQSNALLSYDQDAAGNTEYDRIFVTENVSEGDDFDHFYQIWHHDVSALRKIKNLSQAVNLGFGNIDVSRNGSV